MFYSSDSNIYLLVIIMPYLLYKPKCCTIEYYAGKLDKKTVHVYSVFKVIDVFLFQSDSYSIPLLK